MFLLISCHQCCEWMIEAIYEKVLSTYLMSSKSWDEKLRVMASKILKQKLEILFCAATKYLMPEPVTFQVDNLGQFVVLWRKADRVLSVGNLLVRKDGKVGKCWFQIADLLFTYKIISHNIFSGSSDSELWTGAEQCGTRRWGTVQLSAGCVRRNSNSAS